MGANGMAGGESDTSKSESVDENKTPSKAEGAGVMGRMQPVEEVIRTTTDAGLKRKLQAAQEIREFASHELQLPDNNSYRTYADLRRPYVVWNIVAVPEFSMQPRQWCFAVVGCVAYRGYYEKSEARAFAEQMRVRAHPRRCQLPVVVAHHLYPCELRAKALGTLASRVECTWKG